MPQPPDALAHKEEDGVAVAVHDLSPGQAVVGFLESPRQLEVTVAQPIPLGHKLALADHPKGDTVTEYGVNIGVATTDIARGDHVHVHNIRSARWPRSS